MTSINVDRIIRKGSNAKMNDNSNVKKSVNNNNNNNENAKDSKRNNKSDNGNARKSVNTKRSSMLDPFIKVPTSTHLPLISGWMTTSRP